MAVALVMALSLLAGGFALGSALDDDDGGGFEDATTPLRPAVVTDPPEEDAPTIPAVPGPLADEDSDEPVADVARVVAPSVVRIATELGQGSGIVWDAENGYLVTNDHVIGNASVVEVQFASGATTTGDVVGGDAARDIAVVRVDPAENDLIEAVFAPTSTVEVGQLAVAIGSPFGLDQTVTAGIVSAVNRVEFGGSDPTERIPVEFIQTDAPINPGNSGGALADRQGRVVGMNTQIRTAGVTESGNVGVGFAVPSDTIILIATRIVNGESLELAFLGIRGDSPTDGTVGAVIVEVDPDTPAELAGFEEGDLIVGLEGEVVASMDELAAEVKLYRPGETVEFEILRDGERLVADVTLGSR